MKAALGNLQIAIPDAINKTVFISETPRPPAWEFMFQDFRFACAFVGCSSYFIDQRIQLFQKFLVLGLPVAIFLPSVL